MIKIWREILPRLIALPCAALLLAVGGIFLSEKPDLLEGIPFGTLVLDKDGNLLRAGLSEDEKYRVQIALEEVSPFATQCLLKYEDQRFFEHPGVDPLAMLRAVLQYPLIGRLAGASTISMQLARMRFKLKTSDFCGKLSQIWRALILERHYDKEELLEAYYNLAPYGSNIEGIEAAARIYFHKSAARLTETECAALTVIPQNPVKRNPLKGDEFVKAAKRFAAVMNLDAPPALKIHGFEDLPFLAPHLSLELEKGKAGSGGIIRSGVERNLQKDLERILINYVQRGKIYGINNAAALIVDTQSMEVRAYAGSASFFDRNIQGQVDGGRARRSPGSTLKPFIYALALEQGLIHPMSILPDSPASFSIYTPENFDRVFRGPVSAKEALKASRNLPAIWLSEKLSFPDLYKFLKSANVRFERGPEYYGLALALGGAEVTMRELASLYAMLANKGLWKALRFSRDDPASPGKRLLSPETAWITLEMLRNENFTAGSKHIPVYSKTGTSNGMRDAWTAGLCGKYVIIVWVGNFDNRANPYFVGAKSAAPLFEEIAASLAFRKKLKDILSERPDNIAEASFCINTGDLDIGQCEAAAMSSFIPGRSPIKGSGILRPVFIDKKTGLRACEHKEDMTEQVWIEFWPSDMKKIFAQAGIIKKDAPPYGEICERNMQSGKGPQIKLPKKNALYQRRLSDKDFIVPLMASADPETILIHWFANSAYIGSSRPEETILWKPEKDGEVELAAVDNHGRSQRQKCGIAALP